MAEDSMPMVGSSGKLIYSVNLLHVHKIVRRLVPTPGRSVRQPQRLDGEIRSVRRAQMGTVFEVLRPCGRSTLG